MKSQPFALTCLAALLLISPLTLAQAKPSAPEVTIYLHNGSDMTGVLTHLDGESYEIQTAKGREKVGRLKYQGMVLNTAEEKKIADQISTDPSLYITSAKYAYELRSKIQARMKEPSKACKPASYPLAHFQVQRDGRVKNLALLVGSGCPELDKALLTAIQEVPPTPLPKAYTLGVFPVNFPYQTPQEVAAAKAARAKAMMKPSEKR